MGVESFVLHKYSMSILVLWLLFSAFVGLVFGPFNECYYENLLGCLGFLLDVLSSHSCVIDYLYSKFGQR